MTVQPEFLALLDPAQIPVSQKMIALYGDRATIHSLILQSLCTRAARGERLALVIGDNHFDVYRLARLAAAQGLDPAALLPRIELSRPFTCYQLQHRITTLAPHAHPWNALYVTGLLEMFYDQDVRVRDAGRLLSITLAHLKTLAHSGLPVLVSMAVPGQSERAHFVEWVKRAADVYWQPAPHVTESGAYQLALKGII